MVRGIRPLAAARSRILPLAAPAAAALALAGCGGSGSEPQAADTHSGPRIGVPLKVADCSDWNAADTAERLGTVRVLREFAGGPTGSPGGHGRTLPDEEAYELLQRWCDVEFADSFQLYKLYVRAAAFQHIPRAPYGGARARQ